MYQTLAWELGLQPERSRASAYRALREEIARLASEARQLPVLIIDEAHNLRNDVLEDLRLLTSFQMDAERCQCLLLAGPSCPRDSAKRHERSGLTSTVARPAS